MTAAVVVAHAPGDPAALPGLVPMLGGERAAALQGLLIRRAAAWAADVAPGAAYVAVAPPAADDGPAVGGLGVGPTSAGDGPAGGDLGVGPTAPAADVAAADVAALLPRGVEAFAAGGGTDVDLLAAAVGRAGRGPLLIVRSGCARLGRAHAAAALDDLSAGCGVVLGAALDGGWYLIGLGEPRRELLAVAEAGRGIGAVLEQVQRYGVEVGLLRHERLLATPDDAAALLADPLTPPDLRAALGG